MKIETTNVKMIGHKKHEKHKKESRRTNSIPSQSPGMMRLFNALLFVFFVIFVANHYF